MKKITGALMFRFLFILPALLLCGCQLPPPVDSSPQSKMTLGTVQQEIHKGMTTGEVVESIGSPNLVTKNADGLEVWVYDKASTEVRTAGSGAYGTLILLGGSGKQSAQTTSQRTLTLILKFKENRLVDFSYRSTSF